MNRRRTARTGITAQTNVQRILLGTEQIALQDMRLQMSCAYAQLQIADLPQH